MNGKVTPAGLLLFGGFLFPDIYFYLGVWTQKLNFGKFTKIDGVSELILGIGKFFLLFVCRSAGLRVYPISDYGCLLEI